LIRSWWLKGRASAILFEKAATTIQHWQRRIAAARRSHTKTTCRKLRKIGITLSNLTRCKWP
jgi:hypothetical protein